MCHFLILRKAVLRTCRKENLIIKESLIIAVFRYHFLTLVHSVISQTVIFCSAMVELSAKIPEPYHTKLIYQKCHLARKCFCPRQKFQWCIWKEVPRKESFVLTDGMFLLDSFNHKRCVHSSSPVVCVLSELQGFYCQK